MATDTVSGGMLQVHHEMAHSVGGLCVRPKDVWGCAQCVENVLPVVGVPQGQCMGWIHHVSRSESTRAGF